MSMIITIVFFNIQVRASQFSQWVQPCLLQFFFSNLRHYVWKYTERTLNGSLKEWACQLLHGIAWKQKKKNPPIFFICCSWHIRLYTVCHNPTVSISRSYNINQKVIQLKSNQMYKWMLHLDSLWFPVYKNTLLLIVCAELQQLGRHSLSGIKVKKFKTVGLFKKKLSFTFSGYGLYTKFHKD